MTTLDVKEGVDKELTPIKQESCDKEISCEDIYTRMITIPRPGCSSASTLPIKFFPSC